ncbi:hypothetical protein LY78DRAFT_166019 [Colletotrichum sublineola]|nr:hypothetical protein LY78DRAFT_166019 [Colletotrichum sublineola]
MCEHPSDRPQGGELAAFHSLPSSGPPPARHSQRSVQGTGKNATIAKASSQPRPRPLFSLHVSPAAKLTSPVNAMRLRPLASPPSPPSPPSPELFLPRPLPQRHLPCQSFRLDGGRLPTVGSELDEPPLSSPPSDDHVYKTHRLPPLHPQSPLCSNFNLSKP